MTSNVDESKNNHSTANHKQSNHRLSIWYHPIYTDGIHPDARFPRERYTKLVEKLGSPKYNDKFIIKQPSKASRNQIIIAHDPNYVDNFLNQNLTEKEIKRIGLTPWTQDIIPRTRFLMGGATAALEQVVEYGGVAGNMAGGTHHAHYGFGSGYCIFNDLAVCALLALDKYGFDRVAILDFDVHQGDGVASLFGPGNYFN